MVISYELLWFCQILLMTDAVTTQVHMKYILVVNFLWNRWYIAKSNEHINNCCKKVVPKIDSNLLSRKICEEIQLIKGPECDFTFYKLIFIDVSLHTVRGEFFVTNTTYT